MDMLTYKIKDVLMFFSAFIISRVLLLKRSNRDIWIITERRTECKDNGYYLFKYLREMHPEIRVYYAIEKSSPQRDKIAKYGNVLNNNSWKHFLYALMASRLIGAFIPCGVPDSICFYKFSNLTRGKRVFLQHGITQANLPMLHFDNTNIDCFICGAKPEYEYICKHFHYPEGNVRYTGFCRFDGLHDFRTEKIVLVMPTWRQWIPSSTWHKNGMGNPNEYEYFRAYKQLLDDVRIRQMLKENNMKLVFYLHHEAQPYIGYFGGSDDILTVATEKDYDVQELLKRCCLLITDYSSVAFDVAYMRKPIIYYQFDRDHYYRDHYQKGYFDFETMGFGKTCEKEEEVVRELDYLLKIGMKLNGVYMDRVSSFFEIYDANNCERVFERILEL